MVVIGLELDSFLCWIDTQCILSYLVIITECAREVVTEHVFLIGVPYLITLSQRSLNNYIVLLSRAVVDIL